MAISYIPEKEEYKKLKPFNRFVLQNFPYIDADFDALTNYELLAKIIEYLNRVIENENAVSDNVKNLYDAFIELQNYVNNYFDNLDVQEEINNKLDEMAESGQLAEIIAQFLEMQFVYGFDTIADMKAGESYVEGSIIRVLGKTSYSTGNGSYYRVRTLTSSDVIDDDNIVALTNFPTLIAEKIEDYAINQINNAIDQINNELTNLDLRLDDLEKPEKWLFIGDSYAEGYSPDGTVTSFVYQLIDKMGLSQNQYIIATHGGASFGNSGAYLFETIIDGLQDDNDITHILIAGGYNDITSSGANILNGINACSNKLKTKFPNAKIYLAYIGGTTNEYHGNIHLKTINYIEGSLNNDLIYLDNLQYVLYNASLFSSDGIHPNQNGQNEIAKALYLALRGEYNYKKFIDLVINIDTSVWSANDIALHLYQNNNVSIISNYSNAIYLLANNTFTLNYNGEVKIGTLQVRNGIIGTNYYANCFLNIGRVVLSSLSNPAGYYNGYGYLTFKEDGSVWLKFWNGVNDTHDNYLNLGGLRQIQISQFSVVYPTDIL